MPNHNPHLYQVSASALSSGLMTPDELALLQQRLLELLGDTAARYRFFESSSIPVELAQELLGSIVYTIGLYLKKSGMPDAERQLKSMALYELHRLGIKEIEEQILMGKRLLDRVKLSAPEITNRSYRDTLRELGAFFQRYDRLYFAHETPSTIDYPLCNPISELSGIEFICEYLRRLVLENEFLQRLDAQRVKALLSRHCAEYRILLINLCEPVAINALGLALINGNIAALTIQPNDRARVEDTLRNMTEAETVIAFEKAADAVCDKLGISAYTEQAYLQNIAASTVPRLRTALKTGNLENILIPF